MAVLADLAHSSHDICKVQQEETGDHDRARTGLSLSCIWAQTGRLLGPIQVAVSLVMQMPLLRLGVDTEHVFALPAGRGRGRTLSTMLQVGTALAVDLSGEEGACAGAALEVAVDARGAFCGATMRAHSAPLHPSSLQVGRPRNLPYPGRDMLGCEGTESFFQIKQGSPCAGALQVAGQTAVHGRAAVWAALRWHCWRSVALNKYFLTLKTRGSCVVSQEICSRGTTPFASNQ